MATAQPRRASLVVAAWLLVWLCGAPAAAATSGPPALPLALQYQGRHYALDGDFQRLELPVGCPGAGKLGVQHRVPLPAARCSGALSAIPSGSDEPIWRSEQVPASQEPNAAADRGTLSKEAASEPWFSFRLDEPPPPASPARYLLQLDIYCDGSTQPTVQTVLFVHAACSYGSSSGRVGAGRSQGSAWVAERLQWARRWAALLALPTWQQPEQEPLPQPSSQALWQQQAAMHAEPLGSMPAGRPAARRLSQSSGLVTVALLPSADNGTVVVDGYSGLARALNSSQQLPPVCGADGAPPPGYPADVACLGSLVLRTAGTQVALLLSLGDGAVLPANVLPADALSISGNASLIGVTRGADGRSLTAQLRVGGTDLISVVVPEGALARYGIANAASNPVTIERDNTPPVPVITTPGATAVTYDTQLFFSISYGEPVMGSDPFKLFGWSGASRLDAVLEVAEGRLDVAVYIVDSSQEADVTLWVNKGTVRDLVGNANTQSAVLTVKYRPKSAGLEGASIAANVFLGSSLVLCTAASYVSSAFLPYAPGVLGCGAISLVGYAQSIYLTGRVSAQWLPENYRQVANSFGWTLGEISLPWADSYPPGIDPAYAFPANPIVLTSRGQQVDAASYPALNPGDVGAAPIVTVIGNLAPLPPSYTAGTTVLNDIPFLTPSEAQLVGAPPDPRRPAKPAPSPEAGTSPKAQNGGQPEPVVVSQSIPTASPPPEAAPPPENEGQVPLPPATQPPASPPADPQAPPPEDSQLPQPPPSPAGTQSPAAGPGPAVALAPPSLPTDSTPPPASSPAAAPSPPALPGISPPAALPSPPAGKVPADSYSPPPPPDAPVASPPNQPVPSPSPPTQSDAPPSPPRGGTGGGAASAGRSPSPSPGPAPSRPPKPRPVPEPQPSPGAGPQPGGEPSAAPQRRRLAQAPAARRGRRSLLQSAATDQPAFEGTLYVVASRGLQYITPDGQLDTEDVLAGSGAVQRAYDVMDGAGDGSAYPRQYYYDRLARTAFWTALFAFVVMAAHLAALGAMMWRHARVPGVMWFPRIETATCLAILPGLAYGAAGLFNCSGGDIALGVILLLLLPVSFLAVSFYLVWRWLQHPGLNKRRAIFVLRLDPLADQIAAAATPAASPNTSPRDTTTSNGVAPSPGSPAAAAAAAVSSGADAAARARRWSFTGLVRSLCGARKLQGDWCAINLDSRFTFKYGPLFEATYGQAMVRRRATYQFDPLRGKIDRGALVPLPEVATISWRGKPLLEPHHLRSSAQLLAVAKVVVLAAATSGVAALDSYIQCCLLVLMYGFYAIYLLAVRPYNVAVMGGFELTATLCTVCMLGLAMAVMDGRGESDLTRNTIGIVMLVIQLIGFLAFMAGAFWVGLRAVWAALGLRRRLRLPPSPADRFADAVHQVMSTDPEILARKYFDRWMLRALGVGLYNRPVWRRETEDLRGLLRATTLPKKRVKHMGSVVRRKTVTPTPPPPGLPAGALALADGSGNSGSEGGSGKGGSTPAPGSGSKPGSEARMQQHDSLQQGLQRDSSDAVIAVPGDRSPLRERPVQPGSELHRQLSDPALLAAAAAAAARQQPREHQA